MLSSTSSFRRLPGGWTALVLAGVVSASVLGAVELYVRARGFKPSLMDVEPLWCRTRAEVRGNAVVVVGSSRLQSGLDPRVLSDALGGRPVVQLALAGGNPIPVLRELAEDDAFTGTIVLEYMPRRLLTPDAASAARMQSFVDACRNPSVLGPVEARLDQALQSHVALLGPELQLFPLVSYVQRHHALPRHNHEVLREDRFNAMFFDPGEGGGGDVWDAALAGDALAARMTELRAAIAKLRGRGGNVVLYRSPVGGAVLAEEEARFPAATHFPRLAHELDVPAIDFDKVPDLRTIQPPDGEHPRQEDVDAITRSVGRELAPLLAHSPR